MSSCAYSNQWLPKLKAKKSEISCPQMKNKCSVPGCKSDRHARGVRYPKDKELCRQWIDAIQIDQSYLEVKALELRVCHAHFRESEFYKINNGLGYKVKNNVVPSLNLPMREETPTQTTEKENGLALVSSESSKNANDAVINETVCVSPVEKGVASHELLEEFQSLAELNATLASVEKEDSIDELRIKFAQIKRLVAKAESALRSIESDKKSAESALKSAELAKKDAELTSELAKAKLQEVQKKLDEERRHKHRYIRLCESQNGIIKKQNKEIAKLGKYSRMMKTVHRLDTSQLRIVDAVIVNLPLANLGRATDSSIQIQD